MLVWEEYFCQELFQAVLSVSRCFAARKLLLFRQLLHSP